MRILICPDKFKGSLTAAEVCAALEKGLRSKNPDLKIISCPLADGGDGSLAVLENYLELETITIKTTDPLGRPMDASYKRKEQRAFIELSAASGLALLSENERKVMKTTSYGTGQLIAHAMETGSKEIWLFIGGSATNDGGTGIAKVLGYQFLSSEGTQLEPIGENLGYIDRIEKSTVKFDLQKFKVRVVCDVDNPLFGPNGAAYVYGPQKGATPDEVELLDRGLRHLSDIWKKHNFPDISQLAGAGAAGGIGGGMVAFMGAELESGTATFLEMSGLEDHIQRADLVITGEGRLDVQTVQGKLVSGVCELARKYKKPVVGVCGSAEKGIGETLGMEKVYAIIERSASLREAMRQGREKLEEIGKEIR